MSILITGGAGYIGSHTCLELLRAGYAITVVDNFSNSSPESLRRVKKLTGKDFPVHTFDLREKEKLEQLFQTEEIDGVIHFAGLKAVGESVAEPLKYFDNNLISTIYLLEAMEKAGVKKLVFSSSATVYGGENKMPVSEASPTGVLNPYGRTKLAIEEMLQDLCAADPAWHCMLLRYFNPVGADESGEIGEDPNGEPANLMPYVSQVAAGIRPKLRVFGNQYPTPDGTGIRDYIHVTDLAQGHIAALKRLENGNGAEVYNLGTGTGCSVLELVAAYEKAAGREIPYEITAPRPGDSAVCYADPALAEKELGWKARRTLEDMCRDAWRWQRKNPAGYAGESETK